MFAQSADAEVFHVRTRDAELEIDLLVDKVVLTTGQAAYRRADGVAVFPLALLGP